MIYRMHIAEFANLKISFNDNSASAEFIDLKSGASFVQIESDWSVASVKAISSKIFFTVKKGKTELDCIYSIESDETGRYFKLLLNSDREFDDGIAYPTAFEVKSGDREYIAMCEGLAHNVEEYIPLLNPRPLYAGTYNSMSFWGISSEKSWLLAAVIANADAKLDTKQYDDGLYRTSVVWMSEKGKWGYCREIRFYIGLGSPITDICRTYRKVAEQKGLIKTLKERAIENKKIDSLAGSANFWIWNNDAMDKMYSKNAVYKKPTTEQFDERKRIGKEIKELGMNNVLWSIIDENIDQSTVEYIKDLGFLTVYYDVYTDVIPKIYADRIPETRVKRCENRMEYWPSGIVIKKDGSYCPAWKLKGKDGTMYDQHKLCDCVATDCAKKFVKTHGADNGIDGVFIDVTLCNTEECYSTEHPQTRREAIAAKNRLFEEVKKLGMFSGSENGHEDAVRNYEYNEGMMSISGYRMNDSGRRMAEFYSDREMEDGNFKYMLDPRFRVPLWELVYHDCQTSYWYWGDSTNSIISQMLKRDLFDILYGLPPIYSLTVENWDIIKDEIQKSYKRTVPSARGLRYARMISFEYLTDDKQVQKTVFDNGCEIIVNFGKNTYIADNIKVAAEDYLINSK